MPEKIAEKWRKSSHSGSSGGDCVEIMMRASAEIAVRDSKDPDGPTLTFGRTPWNDFLALARSGELG